MSTSRSSRETNSVADNDRRTTGTSTQGSRSRQSSAAAAAAGTPRSSSAGRSRGSRTGGGGSSSAGQNPEEHWRSNVLAEVSREQIGFLAEGLFKELWARCGREVAIDQVSLMIAEVQFTRGFDLLYKVHDNEAALLEFQKSLQIREAILGRDHRDTGKTYCFVGHALREQREYDSALGQYRSALRILVVLLGKNHNHTKDVISCVDDVLKAKGVPDDDVSDYLTCLLTSMEHKRHGDELMETNGGDYEAAIQAYQQALIVEELGATQDGKYHPDTGEIYSKIGACLARIGDLKAACVEYSKALSIYAVTLGTDHKITKDVLKNIQNLPSFMR